MRHTHSIAVSKNIEACHFVMMQDLPKAGRILVIAYARHRKEGQTSDGSGEIKDGLAKLGPALISYLVFDVDQRKIHYHYHYNGKLTQHSWIYC